MVAMRSDVTPDAGDVVRVNNGGNWELHRWNGAEYVIIAIKNGTIELANSLYDYSVSRYGFDTEVFDFQLFDQEPQIETRKMQMLIELYLVKIQPIPAFVPSG